MLSKNYLSLTVQSVYVVLTSLQLIFVPNMLLGMFGFEPTSEIWIKVLGLVVLSLYFLYNGINKSNNAELVWATVYSRVLVGTGFLLLVLTGQAKAALILFAGIDIVTAIWSWQELKKVRLPL